MSEAPAPPLAASALPRALFLRKKQSYGQNVTSRYLYDLLCGRKLRCEPSFKSIRAFYYFHHAPGAAAAEHQVCAGGIPVPDSRGPGRLVGSLSLGLASRSIRALLGSSLVA